MKVPRSIHSLLSHRSAPLFAIGIFLLLSPWRHALSQTQPGQILGIGNTTSTPVPGVPHDYLTGLNEIVDPANGALSVRIKAPTPHERGVNWPTYVFTYDSNGQFGLQPTWATFNSNGGTFTDLHTLQLINEGVPSLTGQSTVETAYVGGPGDQTMLQCQITSGFVFVDSNGGLHGLGLEVATPLSSAAESCSYFPGGNSNYYEGGDSQYRAIVNPTTLAVSVVDNHGNLVAGAAPGSKLDAPEDANGNYFNTTGRTWAWVSTTTPPGYTITVPGVTPISGLSVPYTVTTTTPNAPSMTLNFTAVYGNSSSGNACEMTSIAMPASPGSSAKTIELPNGQSYQFQYDPTFGLINKITYPTGAWVQYTWSVVPDAEGIQFQTQTNGGNGGLCSITHDWFAITKRVVSYDGVHSAEEQDFSYTTNWPAPGNPNSYQWITKKTKVTTKDLLRGTSFDTVYNYSPILPPPEATSESAWEVQGYVPQEQSIIYYADTTDTTTLKTVTKTWQSMSLLSGECETLPNGNTSGKFYTYSQYGGLSGALNPEAQWTDLPTDVAEYDFGTVSSSCAKPSSTPMRETKTTYATFGNTPLFPYASILDRPSTIQVYGGGVLLSETDYTYDGSTPTYVAAYGHDDANYGSGATVPRGNPTTITTRCFVGSTNCTNSVTTYTYDTTGQVLTATDGCGNATCSDMTGSGHTTTYSYTDNYTNGTPPSSTNAYVTTIANALGQTTKFQWGFEDGKIWSKTDENNQITSYCYTTGGCGGSSFDPFYRLTGVKYPDSGQEKVTYSDAGPTPSVTSSTLLTGSNWLTKETLYDAMGHPTTTEITSDPEGTDYTATTYDGLAHAWTVTNPYRSTSDATYGVTTYTYDALDRKTIQTQPDGSTQQWCYNDIAGQGQTNCTAHLGSVTTGIWVDFNDETGRHWQNTSDSLGRLTDAIEDASNSKLETDYQYDALGDLLRVDQWGGAHGASGDRVRTFSYDSLSRLISATNPESGASAYTYDANGNVTSKTDARGITATNTYDALNRLLAKSYSDGSLSSCFQYDGGATNGVGRLTNEWTQAGACPASVPTSGFFTLRSMLAYDPMGRVTSEQQCTPTKCSNASGPSLGYGYDLAGDMTSLSNSAGTSSGPLSLTYGFDAAEHLISVVSNVTSFPTNLYTVPAGGYGPVGPLNWTLGPKLSVTQGYTNRLWINNISATGQVP